MMRIKRIHPLAAALLLAPLLGGCQRTEVRDRSFIQAAGISGQATTAVQLLPFDCDFAAVASASGTSLATALEQAEGQLGSDLFLGHTELLAVGTGNLTARLTALLDDHRLSPACKLFFAADGISDPAWLPVLRQMAERGLLIAPGCGDGLRDLLGRAGKTVLPCVREGALTLAVVDGAGARLRTLDADACRGLFWLTGQSAALQLPVGTDGASFAVSRNRMRLTAAPDADGTLVVTVTLRLQGKANGATATAAQAEAERLCAAAFAQTVRACGADVIGLEDAVRRENPQFYAAHAADWDTVLRSAELRFR